MKTNLSKNVGLLICFVLPFLAHAQMAFPVTEKPGAPAASILAAAGSDSASPDESEGAASTQVNLFLHTDKTIYQSGETIWFTGYILNRIREIMRQQNTLYVILVDAVTRSSVIRQRFLIHNGVGEGSITLPDSLSGGDYWLMAYTNASLESSQSQPLFRQLITVRGLAAPPFRIIAQSLEPGPGNTHTVYATFKIGTSYGGLASGGTFAYSIFTDTSMIGTGRQTIDAFGIVRIPVDTTRKTKNNLELTAIVERGDLSRKFLINLLPIQQQPIAEIQPAGRSALMHPRVKVTLDTDSSGYHPRSTVILHIQITDAAGNPLQGVFSLSVSQRVDTARNANITNYTRSQILFAHLTTTMINKPDYGQVLYLDKKPNKRISLAVIGNQFSTLETEPDGSFDLPASLLLSPAGMINYLSVANKSAEDYKLIVRSRGDELDEQIASIHYPLNFQRPPILSDSDEARWQSSAGTLQAAIVRKKVGSEYTLSGDFTSRNCDQDFVCSHPEHCNHIDFEGFLNCPEVDRRPCNTTKPMEGYKYLYHPPTGGVIIINYHCGSPTMPKFMIPLKPIVYNPPSFPLQDLCRAETPILQSTIYWIHRLTTDEQGQAIIAFHTNDLTGKFDCILQGISGEGALFGQISYMVTP